MNCDDKILAWHFVGETLRDGRAVPADGEILTHVGPVIPCRQGLHASERLIDALSYAPGHTLCRVECWGDVREDSGDKLAARNRRILWRIDAEPVLREFARRCAISVLHLWDAPAEVRAYLETGDEALRDAARVAATDAAEAAATDAAEAAARVAAEAAARDAARVAARDAARVAARVAAEAAAWDAARVAPWVAAEAAARDAAEAAARDAAWFAAEAAAWDAAEAAAWDAANTLLTELAETAHRRSVGEGA